MKLILGDCLEKMKEIPDDSVDMVLTDPPYDSESTPSVLKMITECERILKFGGNLIFLCGHHQLFEIIKYKTSLRQWWIGWFNHNRSNRIFGKNLITRGKPFIWFNKKKRLKTSRVPFDTISLPKECWSKKFHRWGQPVEFFEHFVEFLSEKGDVVLDPFLGSGSTAVACKNLGREFIGIEKDKNYFNIAKERITSADFRAVKEVL